jgi:hypothetical protein
MDSTPVTQPSPDPDGDNPLQFWVAYIPGQGGKKNYLSDGKGNLRIFKSESALREYLRPQLRPEVYEMVVVHPVQGKIALPDDGTFGTPPRPPRRIPEIIPLDMRNLKPITTLAPPTVPTAQELLDNHVRRRQRRH